MRAVLGASHSTAILRAPTGVALTNAVDARTFSAAAVWTLLYAAIVVGPAHLTNASPVGAGSVPRATAGTSLADTIGVGHRVLCGCLGISGPGRIGAHGLKLVHCCRDCRLQVVC